jgi:hypothetical protein
MTAISSFSFAWYDLADRLPLRTKRPAPLDAETARKRRRFNRGFMIGYPRSNWIIPVFPDRGPNPTFHTTLILPKTALAIHEPGFDGSRKR